MKYLFFGGAPLPNDVEMVEASTLDLARSVVAEAISRAVAEELEAIRDIAVPRRRKRDEASGCDEDEAAAAAKKKHESGLAVARNKKYRENQSVKAAAVDALEKKLKASEARVLELEAEKAYLKPLSDDEEPRDQPGAPGYAGEGEAPMDAE